MGKIKAADDADYGDDHLDPRNPRHPRLDLSA
jgi:hypothetical protein